MEMLLSGMLCAEPHGSFTFSQPTQKVQETLGWGAQEGPTPHVDACNTISTSGLVCWIMLLAMEYQQLWVITRQDIVVKGDHGVSRPGFTTQLCNLRTLGSVSLCHAWKILQVHAEQSRYSKTCYQLFRYYSDMDTKTVSFEVRLFSHSLLYDTGQVPQLPHL